MTFNFEMDDEPDGESGRRALIIAVAGFITIVVVVLLVLAGPIKNLFGSGGDYSGKGSGSVTVIIHDGDSASTIGHTLADAGVVRSASAFTSAASLNARSRQIGPGTYDLRKHMKAAYAVSLLLDPSSRVDYRVTIPEGFTVKAIVMRIAADTKISKASLEAVIRNPAPLGLPSYANGQVEGFLFPATYDIQPGETATAVLQSMVTRFDQAAAQAKLASGARSLGISEYDVIILASMVQAEGRLLPDFPKIAEVFLNRIHAGMPLGSDATLIYALGHAPLTATDLQSTSPYNTRFTPGYPPTPINSPGQAAIDAVLHHANSSYLYFVTIDQAGHTAYAKTLARFNALVAQSQANGVH